MDSKHRLVLEDRKLLTLSGIRNVDSFSEQSIALSSELGAIDITGEDLKITELDLTHGNISIQGQIDSLTYGRSREERTVRHKSKSALARLLK